MGKGRAGGTGVGGAGDRRAGVGGLGTDGQGWGPGDRRPIPLSGGLSYTLSFSRGLVQVVPPCVGAPAAPAGGGGVLSHPAGERLLRLTPACGQGILSQEGASLGWAFCCLVSSGRGRQGEKEWRPSWPHGGARVLSYLLAVL